MKTRQPHPRPESARSVEPSASRQHLARQVPATAPALTRSPRMAAQRQTLQAAFGLSAEPAQLRGDVNQRQRDEMPVATADKPLPLTAHAAEPESTHRREEHLGQEAWHLVQPTPGRVKTTAQMVGMTQREVLQRAPFVVDPTTFREVDLGDANLTLEGIEKLHDSMPFQMQDQFAREFRQAIRARRGVPVQHPGPQDDQEADQKAESVLGSMGQKIIAATNALKASGGSSTDQETKPLVQDPERDERVGASAAGDVAATVLGSAVSIATSGISGKAQSVASTAASGAKIVQIRAILASAEQQFAQSHGTGAEAEPLRQLIPALTAVSKSQWLETLGKGVGIVVPGAGSAAAAAAKSPEDLGIISALAGQGNELALAAVKVLGLDATGDAKNTYGGL